MAIVAVSISPTGEGVSVSRHVAATQRVLRAQDRVRYRLDPMFTTLERVGTVIKIDDRRDRDVRMEEKLRSVEEKLRSVEEKL